MKAVFALLIVAVMLTACGSPKPVLNNTTPAPLDPETVQQPIGLAEIPNGPLGVSVNGELVTYAEGTQGYLAYPTKKGEYPGVILIHEWWGLNDNMKRTAEELATNGYWVIAVDLYNGRVATNATQAQQYRTEVDPAVITQNLAAAEEYLKTQGATKVGSWGYCFGGGESMRYTLEDTTDATVVYYGDLQPALLQPQKVDAPLLLIYGDQDTVTPASTAQELKTKLKPYGVDTEVYIYPGVGHAFANPSNPTHNVEHTFDAWQKSVAFLDKTLK